MNNTPDLHAPDLQAAVDLHAAIDTVARRLTAGDAPANLRAAVVARLDDRRSPAWWRQPLPAFAAVIVVAIAGGVTIMQVRAPRANGTTAAPTVASALPLAAPQPSLAPPAPMTASAPAGAASPRTRSAARPSREPGEAELAWHTRRIPALVAPDAIAFDEIQPVALTMPLLNVTPIVTPPIAPPADGGGSH